MANNHPLFFMGLVTFPQSAINFCCGELDYSPHRGLYGHTQRTFPDAIAIPFNYTHFADGSGVVGSIKRTGTYFHFLCAVLNQQPTATNTNTGKSVLQTVSENITFMLTGSSDFQGSHDPYFRGPQNSHYGGPYALAGFAMLRWTPVIWNQLSATQKEKMEFYALLCGVVGKFTTDNYNNSHPSHSIDLHGQNGTNPNQRIGPYGLMAAIAFLSTSATADDGMDVINDYTAGFTSSGFDTFFNTVNSTYQWKNMAGLISPVNFPEVKDIMVNGGSFSQGDYQYSYGPGGIRTSFTRYYGRKTTLQGSPGTGTVDCPGWGYASGSDYVSATIAGIFEREVIDFCIHSKVRNTMCESAPSNCYGSGVPAHKAAGTPDNPLTGTICQGAEFNFNGRSSQRYTSEGITPALMIYSMMAILGLWKNTSTYNSWRTKFYNCVQDFKFKVIDQGPWLDTDYGCGSHLGWIGEESRHGTTAIYTGIWQTMFQTQLIDWSNLAVANDNSFEIGYEVKPPTVNSSSITLDKTVINNDGSILVSWDGFKGEINEIVRLRELTPVHQLIAGVAKNTVDCQTTRPGVPSPVSGSCLWESDVFLPLHQGTYQFEGIQDNTFPAIDVFYVASEIFTITDSLIINGYEQGWITPLAQTVDISAKHILSTDSFEFGFDSHSIFLSNISVSQDSSEFGYEISSTPLEVISLQVDNSEYIYDISLANLINQITPQSFESGYEMGGHNAIIDPYTSSFDIKSANMEQFGKGIGHRVIIVYE